MTVLVVGERRWLAALSDRALGFAIGATLFVLSAWPIVLVELPPFQDLPNHLASAYIVNHLDRYPDYVFNGFWKSNSLFGLWLSLFSDHDLLAGARSFVALAIAANAFVLPWLVLQLAGRRSMVIASLVLWPLVHSFFLSMGMLNFTIAFPLSLVLLVMLGRQRAAPSTPRAIAIVVLSFVVWYAHPFPLVVIGLLCLVEVGVQPGWRARLRSAIATLLPLAPIGVFLFGTALHHLIKVEGVPLSATKGIVFLMPWELPVHFWLDASGALTRWGSMTAIPAIVLPILAWRGRKTAHPMLGSWGTIALVVGYLGLPVMASNWWHLNARLVPFVWVAFAVRVPQALPRSVIALLVASALAFSVVLGIDYVRLDHDRAELTAGIEAVPERATLLPLLFRRRKTSEFTESLTHAWAYYVLAKQTSAPLVFALERSYQITYRTFPPEAVIPPALDGFAERYATPAQTCAMDRKLGLGRDPSGCAAVWRLLWAQFWQTAEPRFRYILAWAMPPEAHAIIPASYHLSFQAGDLEIYARQAVSARSADPSGDPAAFSR